MFLVVMAHYSLLGIPLLNFIDSRESLIKEMISIIEEAQSLIELVESLIETTFADWHKEIIL